MNWIGASQPDYVALIQHSNTEIPFLTHVEKMLTITPDVEKHVATHGVRGTDEGMYHADFPSRGRALPHGFWVHADVDEGNADRTNPWMIKFSQSSLNSVSRVE
jgi:hypothetical protein